MVRIEQGGEYTAKRFRSGTGDKGDWELVVVKAEGKARQELVIFPTNIPSGITEDGTFRVDNIRSVEIRVQKNPDGTWGAEKTRVEAEVTAIVYDDLDDLYSGDFDLCPLQNIKELPRTSNLDDVRAALASAAPLSLAPDYLLLDTSLTAWRTMLGLRHKGS